MVQKLHKYSTVIELLVVQFRNIMQNRPLTLCLSFLASVDFLSSDITYNQQLYNSCKFIAILLQKITFGTHLLCFSSFCTFCYSMSDRKVNTKCFNKSIKTVRISISVCLTKRNQIYTMYSIYAVAMSHTQREIRTHQFV